MRGDVARSLLNKILYAIALALCFHLPFESPLLLTFASNARQGPSGDFTDDFNAVGF